MTEKLLAMTKEQAVKRLNTLRDLLAAEEALGTFDDLEIAVLKGRVAVVDSFIAAMTEVDTNELDNEFTEAFLSGEKVFAPSHYLLAHMEGK